MFSEIIANFPEPGEGPLGVFLKYNSFYGYISEVKLLQSTNAHIEQLNSKRRA